MAEPGLIGHITGGDEKKLKGVGEMPLIIPSNSPSYHVLLGGVDSHHEEVLGALIQSALLAGNTIVAFDTTGMIVPFLLPFLPGDNVKKARVLKERIPAGLIDNMKPAGVFFNSQVEETTGSAIKGWFSLPKILLDAAKLSTPQQETLSNTFGISKKVLMKDVLQSVVAVAFGKDYTKVKEKATAFVDYLVSGFERLSDRGLPYPTWVYVRDALFKGTLDVPKPPSLRDNDIDAFATSLDYYIANALLFKPPRPGPAAMDLEGLESVNFILFYLQDMEEREQVLAFTLLFAQHAIATVTKPGSPGDPISIAMRHDRVTLAFDELGKIIGKGHPVLQPLASAIALLREAAMHKCSLLMATRAPSSVDLELLETDVLGSSLARDIETNIYVGKVKEKEGLSHLVSWLGSKGAKVGSAAIEGLKSSQALLVPLKATEEPVRFDVLESGMMSAAVTPALLKTMLATPILVSKKPTAVPSGTLPPKEVIPSRPGTKYPFAPFVLQPQTARVEPKTPPIPADPTSPQAPLTPSKPQILPDPKPIRTPTMVVPEKEPVPSQVTERVDRPVVATQQTPQSKAGVPVVEELLDQYEPGENDSDDGLIGEKGDGQGDMSSDLDFLSRLLGTTQATGDGKLSRMDYNMVLNALLYKLEKVVKASFGVQFFKELRSSKKMSYDRAMEMYYQESNAMLKGKFAVQRGEMLIYQGIKEAVLAIIAELGLQIPIPSDEDLGQLETELLKAMAMPRHELLKRIKDGSLYF